MMSKHIIDKSICDRAVYAIETRHEALGVSIDEVMQEIGLIRMNYYKWKYHEHTPSIYALQQMALAGYDVLYILTGKIGAA